MNEYIITKESSWILEATSDEEALRLWREATREQRDKWRYQDEVNVEYY